MSAAMPVGDLLVALARPEGGLLIGQHWFGYRTGKVHAMALTFNSVDPRTGESGPSYEEASPEDVRAAVEAATAVHRSGALRDRAKRVALLRGAAARLRAAGDEIIPVCEAETGLPEVPRLRSELERTCGQLEAFAAIVEAGDDAEAIIDHPDPDAKPIPKPDVRRMRVPLGPVAVFGASNFPLAFSTAGGDTASALAAGCPVIVKGHPSHPGTGELVARELSAAVADAGLPEGTFAHLPAAGVEVGEALVDAPEIAAVGFTGSFNGGKAIFDRAARRAVPIPVYAEMGSINPIVVTEAALRERGEKIAEGLTASVASFGGQLCTKPGVVFVPEGEAGDAFAADLAARLDAADPQVLLNERLRDALRAGVDRLEGHARRARRRPRRRTARASATSRPPTRRPLRSSVRSCSRSTSARSSCCCATAHARSCSPRSTRSRASSPGPCTRSPARTWPTWWPRSASAPAAWSSTASRPAWR